MSSVPSGDSKPESIPGYADNPAAAVRAAFSHIAATRMADLPINNPALQVDVMGFRDWEGQWVGVLVTPWAIDLIIVPGEGAGFRRLGIDQRQTWVFPSGSFEFLGGDEPPLGPYQSCSLFAPVHEFTDHDSACRAAMTALEALFVPEAQPAPPAEPPPERPRTISRRDLLRGRFFGNRR